MAAFLQSIIPVDIPIWIFFFILPTLLSFWGQLLLCKKAKRVFIKFVPFYVAGILLILVFLYRFTGALDFLIEGFLSLLLLGTACFIFAASILGWITYYILYMRKR